MDKKIKVYMQFPWRVCDSNYYKFILDYPPEGVEYINKIRKIGNTSNSKSLKFNDYLKKNIKKLIKKINPYMANAHLTKYKGNYDLIHCAHCLSKNNKPWVTDIEWIGQFWAGSQKIFNEESKKQVRKYLMNTNCKKIIAWSEWSKQKIIEIFPEIEKKIEIMHYAIPEQKRIEKKNDKTTLLFFSRRFYFKGGLHAVEVMNRLTKKYKNVYGLVVSEIPEHVLENYSENKKIEFISNLLPYEKIINDIFPKSDIFVYPSYHDTYGFPLIEAQSFGIPIVTVDGDSRKEIVADKKAGFVISSPKDLNHQDKENFQGIEKMKSTIKEIEYRTEELIKNRQLREKMGEYGRKEVTEGKFSLKKRNEKLRRIYQEAIK